MTFGDKGPMTPDEFRSAVLPQMASMWDCQCFCDSPYYQRIVGFNFCDYNIGPVGLADSEILVQAFVRDRCAKIKGPDRSGCEITQIYECPRCHRQITEHYDEYSINMSRTYIEIHGNVPWSKTCLFMIGWYGFVSNDFSKITGYEKTDSIDQFLRQMKVAEQGAQPDAFGAG